MHRSQFHHRRRQLVGRASQIQSDRLGTTPLSFDVEHLAPGEYDCQVTVLDPADSKATFWRAPIKIMAE